MALFEREQLKKVLQYLKSFFINPVQAIKHLPDWPWPIILALLATVSWCSSVINSVFAFNIFSLIQGIFLSPFISLILTLVTVVFLYYIFLFVSQRVLPFKALFTLVVLSNIPFFAFQSLSNLLPPISLLGLTFTAIILFVGLVENFALEKWLVKRVISFLFIVFIVLFIFSHIKPYLVKYNQMGLIL